MKAFFHKNFGLKRYGELLKSADKGRVLPVLTSLFDLSIPILQRGLPESSPIPYQQEVIQDS
jgi:hypothetical protein